VSSRTCRTDTKEAIHEVYRPTVLGWVWLRNPRSSSSLLAVERVKAIVVIVGTANSAVFSRGRWTRCPAVYPSLKMIRQNEIPITGPVISREVNLRLVRTRNRVKLIATKDVHRAALSMKTRITRVARDCEMRAPDSRGACWIFHRRTAIRDDIHKLLKIVTLKQTAVQGVDVEAVWP